MNNNYRILVFSGPSGGHLFPAIAIADELKKLKKIKFEQDKETESKSDLLMKLTIENQTLKQKHEKLSEEDSE